MYFRANDLLGYRIEAVDGEVGLLEDCLFEGRTSKIRYLVIDLGGMAGNRKALLAPAALGRPDPDNKVIATALTSGQVESSPPMRPENPLSREAEEILHRHHGWTPYWMDPPPDDLPRFWAGSDLEPNVLEHPRLHSIRDVLGAYVQARDGDIGHVEDLLIDEADWMLRYLVINTRNWLAGRTVAVASDCLDGVDWQASRIAVDLDRDRIKNSPAFDAEALDSSIQQSLIERHGRDPFQFGS